jgi:hypothetical protein
MYLRAAKHLDVSSGKVAMVAANVEGVCAAAGCGLFKFVIDHSNGVAGKRRSLKMNHGHEEFDVVVNGPFLELVQVIRR